MYLDTVGVAQPNSIFNDGRRSDRNESRSSRMHCEEFSAPVEKRLHSNIPTGAKSRGRLIALFRLLNEREHLFFFGHAPKLPAANSLENIGLVGRILHNGMTGKASDLR